MIDPQGVRTLGVLTKCDAIQHGDEKRVRIMMNSQLSLLTFLKVMRIAENKVEHLPHGWFIVKNRSPQEIEAGASLTERYANERTFFAATPWNRLDYHRVGIESLRHSIWNLVNDIMHDDLTGLLEKIQNLAHETITASHTELSFTNEKLIPHERRWKSVSSTAISALPYTGDLGKEPEIEKKNVDIERGPVQKRPTILINACVVALTIGFCLMLVGLAIRKIAQEIATDGNYLRMLLLITIPLQIFVSLVSYARPSSIWVFLLLTLMETVLLPVFGQFPLSIVWPSEPNEVQLEVLFCRRSTTYQHCQRAVAPRHDSNARLQRGPRRCHNAHH